MKGKFSLAHIRVSKRCDRTVAQNLLEIVQDLGFEHKNEQITTDLSFFGSIFNCFVGLLPILFAQNFQTEILGAQKNLHLESLPT